MNFPFLVAWAVLVVAASSSAFAARRPHWSTATSHDPGAVLSAAYMEQVYANLDSLTKAGAR